MHLLLLLVVLGLVVVIVLQLRGNPAPVATGPVPQGVAGKPANHSLAFISRGKLFYKVAGQELREVQSPYIQGVMDRAERSRQLHGWKEGTAFAQSYTGRQRGQPLGEVQIQATSALFTAPDRMLYFLKDESFGGLFEHDLADGSEKRLVHKQKLVLEDLRLNDTADQLLCSQHASTGTANIAVMNVDGSGYRDLSGGDTVDTAPSWVPGQPHLVLYQSSGIARDPAGYVVAHGPASVQMLNTKEGTVSSVLEDDQWDYMQPRVNSHGLLYFIRRPYEAPRYSTKNILLDTLLFPFRLLRALFHYLNFFSLMYTRKPLSSASGPAVQADLKDILLKGKRFDAENALRNGAKVNGVPSLVPASWQLVCRSQKAEEWVLASHVASFDIAANGAILFSNGYGVFALDGSGPPKVLLKEKLIGDVIVGPVDAGG